MKKGGGELLENINVFFFHVDFAVSSRIVVVFEADNEVKWNGADEVKQANK